MQDIVGWYYIIGGWAKRKWMHCWGVDGLLDAVQPAEELIVLPGDVRLSFGGGGESGVEDGVFVAQATHLRRRTRSQTRQAIHVAQLRKGCSIIQ